MTFPTRLRCIAAVAALALSGCAVPGPEGGAGPQVAQDGPVRVALLVPLGSTDEQREALAQSLVNAAELARDDLRGVEIALGVHATAGDPAVAATAMQTALAEGADIVLGPLFAGATEAVAPVAGTAGLSVLSLSNTPSVAGGNVWILGNTYENTAARTS